MLTPALIKEAKRPLVPSEENTPNKEAPPQRKQKTTITPAHLPPKDNIYRYI